MVVVFPVSKISDVTLAAELCRPCFGGIHHRIVEAYRKKYRLTAPLFFLIGRLDFVFDPLATDGVLG